MNIMLVDDEHMALEHLEHLISWESHGFTIVATAQNGENALQLYDKYRPQIIIVDIRMPLMDGLQLIRAIQSKTYNVKFIITSAYKDFEYARQAIELGVSNYLVKHTITPEKLLEELRKVKQIWKIEEEHRRMSLRVQIKNLLTTSTDGVKLKLPAYSSSALLLLQLDIPYLHTTARQSLPDLETVFTDNSKFHNEVWDWIGGFVLAETQFVIWFTSNVKSMRHMQEAFRALAIQIQNHLYEHSNISVSAIHTFEQPKMELLPLAFRRIKNAAEYSLFLGKKSMVNEEQLPLLSDGRHTPALVSDWSAPLIRYLEKGDKEGIRQEIHTVFKPVCSPYWDLRGLNERIAELRGLLQTLRKRAGLMELCSWGEAEGKANEPIYSIDDLQKHFTELFHNMVFYNSRGRHLSHKVQKALQYIHTHFHEDLSIEHVAAYIGISSSYFYLLFKREVGGTFLEYVTEYRISQAKIILRQETVKMSDIAARVGYRSTAYFSQVFKRTTGMLPHQYRARGEST